MTGAVDGIFIATCFGIGAIGWFALLDSFAAGYLGAAIVLNVSMGKEHLPLFPTKLGKA